MSLFDWECFESVIHSRLYNVLEADELHTPSYELSLKRDENLQIHLTSKSKSPKRSDRERHELGTVRESQEKATLKSKVSESCVFLDGVVVNATNEINNASEQKYIEDHASIHSVKGELKKPESGRYLFEWLENLNDGFYLWPDMLHLEKSEHVKIKFGDKKGEGLSFQETNRSELRSCRSVARLVIKNTELFLIANSQDGSKRGSILYTK